MEAREEVMPSHKTKKAQESINSKLAGHEEWQILSWILYHHENHEKGKIQISDHCQQLSCSQNLKWNTMLCSQRLTLFTTRVATLILVLLAVNSSVYLALLSPMVEIPIF